MPKLIVKVLPLITGVSPGFGAIEMEMMSRKTGLVSVKITPVAFVFPLFPTVIVYTTVSPTMALVGLPNLVTAGSAMRGLPTTV